MAKLHIPVMLKEATEYLNLSPGNIVVDATVGTAGHSEAILESITPGGRLIAVDRDQESLVIAKERLKRWQDSCSFVHGNFSDINIILGELGIKRIDGILFDLGLSTFQLDNPERGFSFQQEGPLDMRMDRESYISAYDLVNNLNEEELSGLIRNYGQERFHNRIAHLLVQEREKHPIATTRELSNIIVRAIPHRFRHYRIHPATRTFQAVRIAVNRELEILEGALEKAISFLNNKGRVCVISFHSLEDRIVKLTFKKAKAQGLVEIVTPKPLVPQWQEVKDNSASRSAKFRVAEKV
ncbi:MAG: 16S rRNA (cytosine(1402)-N(4))-methyltransferase RsmH [Candidatus Omnitrophica bacterium]|nr:16S rRNA (cytosine(1402)-N(4))-methyltransferase RsmH [Candidatus Omnitrophota bacterium]